MNDFDVWSHHLNGQSLIEAGAGTGKTYTLSALYLRYLIEDQSLLPENILVLTFTNAATSELKTRLRQLLIDAKNHLLNTNPCNDDSVANYLNDFESPEIVIEKLKTCLLSFDKAAIFTIHGFCKKVISDFNSECGSPCFYQLVDSKELIKNWVYDFYRQQQKSTPAELMRFAPKPDSLLGLMSSLINKRHFADLAPIQSWREFDSQIEEFKSLKQTWLDQAENLMDYLLSGDLNKSSYKPSNRAKYLNQIDLFFSGSIKSDLKKYKATHIQSKFLKAAKPKPIPKFFYDFEEFCQHIYNFEFDVKTLQIAFAHECWQHIKKQQQKILINEGKYNYDHLVETVANACQHSPKLAQSITSQWPLLLVDEFQDTDSLQLSIFEHCYLQKGHNVVFVGDPKQAIYDFRGGDVFVYQKAKEKISHHFSLKTNWRSSESMLDKTNQLFNYKSSFHLNWIHFQSSLCSPKTSQLKDSSKESLWVFDANLDDRLDMLATEIKRLLNQAEIIENNQSRVVFENDIAVLVSSNQQAKNIYIALLKKGLKVSLWSDDSVMQSETAKDLYYLVRALDSPTIKNINTSLQSCFFGLSLEQIHSIKPEDRLQQFIGLKSLLKSQSLSLALQNIIQKESIDLNLLNRIDGERRLMDLQHLIEIIQANFNSSQNIKHLLEGLTQELTEESPIDEEDLRKRKLESDGNKITIQTIHKSKGLEFAVVFMPYADHLKEQISTQQLGTYKFINSLHNDDRDGFINWRVGNEYKKQLEDEHIAVQRRKLYVAFTRSKYRLYLGMDSKSSAYKKSCLSQILEASDADYSLVNKFAEETFTKPILKQKSLNNNKFTAILTTPQKTTSFSGLNSHKPTGHYIQETKKPKLNYQDYLHFPKGALSGTIIHKILELIPFSASKNQIELEIKQQFKLYQIPMDWSPVVVKQIQLILQSPFWNQGPCLKDLKQSIDEMEFLLPFEENDTHVISNWLSQHRGEKVDFKFDSIKGYLSGFIDLVFEWQGKYYILDYKNNHLGYEINDYSTEAIKNCVQESHYDLQYLLYSVALVKTLKTRLPKFNIEKDFGGAIYLFTRGVNGINNAGMHFNRPNDQLLEQMLGSFYA